MTRVAVSNAVLGWAIERSGSPEHIREKFPKLPDWLQGKRQPTLRQLEDFAKATSTPLGYLFLSEPPEEQITVPNFRTLNDVPLPRHSPDLIETIHTMEQRQAWMREYLIGLGQEPLAFVHSARLKDDPKQIASEIRRVLGFTDLWASKSKTWEEALKNLETATDSVGIIVTVNGVVGNNNHRRLDPYEFRGFVLIDEFAPLIFINGADGKAAQMFTLAHELAHVWFGSGAIFDLKDMQPAKDETEQACNLVAAEFLIPEAEFYKIWPSVQMEPDRFQKIARHFKVSEIVTARRALDLKGITIDEFLKFYRNYTKDWASTKKKQGGGNFFANQPFRIGRRFGESVVRATRDGKLLYRDAYMLTGLYGKTFEKFAENLGLGGL